MFPLLWKVMLGERIYRFYIEVTETVSDDIIFLNWKPRTVIHSTCKFMQLNNKVLIVTNWIKANIGLYKNNSKPYIDSIVDDLYTHQTSRNMSYGARCLHSKGPGSGTYLSIFIANTNFSTLYSLESLDLATG